MTAGNERSALVRISIRGTPGEKIEKGTAPGINQKQTLQPIQVSRRLDLNFPEHRCRRTINGDVAIRIRFRHGEGKYNAWKSQSTSDER